MTRPALPLRLKHKCDGCPCACGHPSPHVCIGSEVEVTADAQTAIAALCGDCPCPGFVDATEARAHASLDDPQKPRPLADLCGNVIGWAIGNAPVIAMAVIILGGLTILLLITSPSVVP